MAGKRTATSDLNHDNWDEYEPEDAGSFKKASEDVLQRRIIKTARRRNPISPSNEAGGTKNVFSSFSGFGKPNPPSSSDSPFAFLSNLSNNTQAKTNGLSNSTPLTNSIPQTAKELNTALKLPENGTKLLSLASKPPLNMSSSSDKNNLFDKNSTDYYAKLKGLNESVSQWIKTHVDKNPFCILTPIFKDYEKYLKEIEGSTDKGETGQKCIENEKKGFTFSTEVQNTSSTTHSSSIFGNAPTKTVEISPFASKPVGNITTSHIGTSPFASKSLGNVTKSVETTPFSSKSLGNAATNTVETSPFASKPLDNPKGVTKSPFALAVSTQPITFNTSSTSFTAPSSGFSFGTGAPFTFTNVAKPPSDSKPTEQAEEEDEPPKVDFTPVVEDDNIFSKRCKVFVKKDGSFGDRGVGQLFLKPVSGSEKIQLIVRADTNLGNLLLNFILSDSIPLQRMGKNNVMLVCIPTPDAKPPPIPVLLRVKTAEEADELLKILEKNKK